MYGYIVPHEDELKIREYKTYRAYYCGLCHQIKNNYGQIPRLTLSYDMTFVYLLLSSLYEPKTELVNKACPLHPFKKHLTVSNKIGSYVADMGVALAYLKLEDDVLDEGKLNRKLALGYLKHHYLKVKKAYPKKVAFIESQLEVIHELERNYSSDLDALSQAFGKVLGAVMVYDIDDGFRSELYDLGYYLGQFIYIMDAYDDLEDDLKMKRFNPLSNRSHDCNLKEHLTLIMEMLLCRVGEIVELLPLNDDESIIKNIIYSGVWTRYRKKEQEE